MNSIQCLLCKTGLVSPFARLKAHHERSLFRMTQKRPGNCLLGQEKAMGGRAKSPFPSRSREGSYPTVVAGRAWCLPRFTHCDFGLYTLVCHLVFSYIMYQNVIFLDTKEMYINIHGYMLYIIQETMKMNYVNMDKAHM